MVSVAARDSTGEAKASAKANIPVSNAPSFIPGSFDAARAKTKFRFRAK
jgi:hypothetical protein